MPVSAADAAALPGGFDRHRCQGKRAHVIGTERHGQHAEQDVPDDRRLLDGHQFDLGEACRPQAVDQFGFVSATERLVVQAPYRGVVARISDTDHHIRSGCCGDHVMISPQAQCGGDEPRGSEGRA